MIVSISYYLKCTYASFVNSETWKPGYTCRCGDGPRSPSVTTSIPPMGVVKGCFRSKLRRATSLQQDFSFILHCHTVFISPFLSNYVIKTRFTGIQRDQQCLVRFESTLQLYLGTQLFWATVMRSSLHLRIYLSVKNLFNKKFC